MTSWVLITFSVFLALTSPCRASEVEVLTAATLKKLLEQKNSAIAAARLEASAANSREGGLVRSFFPSLEIQGGRESSKFGSDRWQSEVKYGVEANFNLYNGGRDEIKSKISSLEVSRKSIQVKRITTELYDRAIELYWMLIYLKEEAALLKVTSEVNIQNLVSAQKRIRSGVAANSDRFEFEMKEADLRRELSKVELKLKEHEDLLRLVLGLKDGLVLKFTEALTHDHAHEGFVNPAENQYEFLFKEQEIISQQYFLSAKERRRSWWPRVDAFASLDKAVGREIDLKSPDEANKAALGLKITLNVPDGVQSARDAHALEQEATAVSLTSEYKRREAAIHLRAESMQLKLLHDQVHETEQNIARAERYYKITQSEYARGVKNSPDVLGASDKLLEAQRSRLVTIRDFQIAKWHIVSKSGL